MKMKRFVVSKIDTQHRLRVKSPLKNEHDRSFALATTTLRASDPLFLKHSSILYNTRPCYSRAGDAIPQQGQAPCVCLLRSFSMDERAIAKCQTRLPRAYALLAPASGRQTVASSSSSALTMPGRDLPRGGKPARPLCFHANVQFFRIPTLLFRNRAARRSFSLCASPSLLTQAQSRGQNAPRTARPKNHAYIKYAFGRR